MPEKMDGPSTAENAGDAAPKIAPSETAAFTPDTSVDPARAADGSLLQTWIGKSLGKYQVTGVLGQGGTGLVLKAQDPMIEREVALKVLAEHLASDASALDRFLAEARAAGKLNHPKVIAIYEICQEGATHILVLEYAPGGSLSDRVAGEQPLPVLEATQALIDACEGVGAAHAAGVIHRDVKPANLMRAADGSVKVADFGLAKAAADAGRHLTQTGVVVGTPFFLSPEQCQAKPVDHRSDLYSLGGTYYSLLTGKNPYQGTDSVPQLMYLHCHGPIPDPRSINPAIPEACSRIIARAMAKAPADRYPSTAEMLADLQAVATTLSGQARIALPSESSTVPALGAPVRSGLPFAGLPIPWAIAGLAFVVLMGLALFLGREWPRLSDSSRGGDPGMAAHGEPVKVGVLHSLSGTMAIDETPIIDAVLFAITEVNQAGGALGRPVKAVVADGRSDGPSFAREAERLIAQEKVCTVFGCWTSASRKTVRPVFEEHDHLLIYPV
ncbi:MAG TPA: bifunctional serine/threonine-protein kinase/ABC transporter substrate-binding protein, partial [Gemmataceae bacterium]|nr:bifunctional serine/threonine-protein kinase/ABC transporter substrate-binding protein [Gemmataceae bacterium]